MNDETNQDAEQALEESADLMTREDEASGEETSGDEASVEETSGEEASGEEASGDEGEADLVEPADEDSVQESGEAQEGSEGSRDEKGNVDLIMDLPLQVVVELGRTKMLINDLLQIGQGSVIELNKQVGEALDILVNGKLVARGEVVVVKDKFGVRITEVLSTIERIKQLA